MGKGQKAADVTGAARTEGEFSRETTRDQTYANRPDQYNALGSNTWQQQNVRDPSTGEMTTKWTSRQNLSPDMQKLYDQQVYANKRFGDQANSMTNRMANEMSQPLDWEQFGDVEAGPRSAGVIGTGIDPTTGTDAFEWDGTSNRQRAEDDAYGRSMQRMNPQFEGEREQLEIRLRNRGLSAGDQQYQSEMDSFNTGKNDAYEMARMGATSEGRTEDAQSYGQASDTWGTNRATEQQRFAQMMGSGANDRAGDQQAFNQEMSANERANALRQQQIAEYTGKRGHTLSEINALRGSQNVGEMTSTFGGG